MMVRKKLAMAVLALGALHMDLASALGMGNVAIRSTLNQPLNAEIRLLDIGTLDASQIKVRLADIQAFERAGVDRDYFLNNLRFDIELDGRGGGVVRVTTREPVIEPYLNFIIETRWPSGRLLREYAVLLDPPTFSGGGAAASSGSAAAPFVPAGETGLATVQQQAPQRRVEPPRVSREAAPAARPAPATMPAAGPGQYRVQQNDTMSSIASRFQSADVSKQQAMLAIQRANPHAFINNNVNLVKSGYILRIPAADEMGAIGVNEAVQEVRAQTQAWRSGERYAGAGETTGPQLDARNPEVSEGGGYREQPQLSIAAPGDSDKHTAGEGAAASGAGSSALRDELASAQESLDSARRDNQELLSRLDDMERQVATLNRLIALKDDQLASLQARSAQSLGETEANALGETEEGALAAEQPAEQLDPVAAEEELVAQAPAAPATEALAEPVEAPPAAAAKPAPTPAAPAPAPGLVQRLIDNPLIPGGIAAVLLLALGGVLVARRRRDAAEQELEPEALSAPLFETSEPVAEAPVFTLEPADTIEDGDVPLAATAPEPEPVESRPPVRPETGDALSEADIYTAYGRYQQAADLLNTAIDAEPERTDLRLKLLEVYLDMRDRDGFRSQYAQLQATGDVVAIGQAKELLSSVDGVSGWLDEEAQDSHPSDATEQVTGDDGLSDFDLDLDLALDEVESAAGDSVAADSDFDFNLDDLGDLDQPVTPLAPESTAVALGDELEDGLEEPGPLMDGSALTEFDLSLDLVEDSTPPATAADEALTAPGPALPESEPIADEAESLELDSDLEIDFDALDGEQGLEDLSAGYQPAESDAPVAEEDDPFDTRALEAALELDEPSLREPQAEDGSPLSPAEAELSDLDLESALLEDEPVADADLSLPEEPDFSDLDFAEGLDQEEAASRAEPAESQAADEDATFRFDEFDDPFAPVAPEPQPLETSASPTAEVPVLDEDADEFDFLSDADEIATKLDLARAYIDMGDTDGAREILDEVREEGTGEQQQEAEELLGRIV